MIELLVAMVMISFLMVSAFLSWGSYVEDARKVSTLNRMDGIRKALEAWGADHTRGYPRYDLNPLLGRYLPNTEGDGWGNDFVIDRYMMRVISRGPNGVLNTPIPGVPEGWVPEDVVADYDGNGVSGDANDRWLMNQDDFVQEARENGRLVLVGSSDVYMVRPDGTHLKPLASGALWGDLSPGGGAVVWGDGTMYERDWLSESDDLGTIDQEGLPVSSVPMTWFSTPFGNNGWGTISIAPDGVHLAAFRAGGGGVQLVVGELVDPNESVSAPTFGVATFPMGVIDGDQYGRIAWGRRSGTLYVNNKEGSDVKIAKINAAPRSRETTYSWGVVDGNTPSVDVCGTRERFVFIHDGKAVLASGSGSFLTSSAVSAGTPVKVAVNRRCDSVAVLDDSDNLYLWWPDRPIDPAPGGEGNPFLVLSGTEVANSVGAVSEMRWR